MVRNAGTPDGLEEHDPYAKLPPRPGLIGRLRNYFLAGVLVAAPVGITLWIAWGVVDFFDQRIKPLIPAAWDPDNYLHVSVPGLGLLLLFVFLILVGMFAAGLVGRAIMRQFESILAAVPVVRSIYGAVKQIFETVFAQNSQAFRKVVLIQYPYEGCWSIAFLTADTRGEVQRVTSEDVVSVFMPAVPNPTTGFLLFVPRHEVLDLDMTVEQGLKLVVSGGIVTPKPGATPATMPPPVAGATTGRPRLSFSARLRNYLIAGILVTAPAAITFWLAWQVISFVDSRVTPLIPAAWNPLSDLPIVVPGLGLVVVFVVLVLIGMLAAGLIGRWLIRTGNWLLSRVPVVRSLYGAIRQIFEAVLASRSESFRDCVLFSYPRRGVWAIGLVTGRTEGQLQELTPKRVINVFLPTTPNPTSGFLMLVPEDEVIRLSMTVEEGLKMVVSGGLVVPPDRGEPQPAAAE